VSRYAEFSLPELNPTASFKQKIYVVPKVSYYDVILGRDFLQKVEISVNVGAPHSERFARRRTSILNKRLGQL